VTYTRWQILFYTVLLVLATMLPWATGMSGDFYLGGALVLGVVFLWYAWRLLDPPDEFFAMRTFQYSIVYLMALFAFLLVDHWLPWLRCSSSRRPDARKPRLVPHFGAVTRLCLFQPSEAVMRFAERRRRSAFHRPPRGGNPHEPYRPD
jgi:hypothetical protein